MILGWLGVTGEGGGEGERKLEAGGALRSEEWVQAGQGARPTAQGGWKSGPFLCPSSYLDARLCLSSYLQTGQ